MKFTLQLVCELTDEPTPTVEELLTFEKDFDAFEDIGLNLSESKEILKNLQKTLIEKQLSAFIKSKKVGKFRKKGSYPIKLKTLFGDISFQSPRYYSSEGGEKKTFSPLNELLSQHITPELLYLETKWASLIPFEKTANLLKEVLPVAETINATTIQHHLFEVALEQEKELGKEQFMFDSGCIREREALPRPERTMVIGIDGGYVRDWKDKKSIFEVIVGKSVPAGKDAKCFGFVYSYDTKPKRRVYEHLKAQGMQPHQTLEFFSDGADNLRNLQSYLNEESTFILDWFHITMRITVLNQYAAGLLKVDKKRGKTLHNFLESIKWNLWHGNINDGIEKIDEIYDYLSDHQEDVSQKVKYDKVKVFEKYASEFSTYITNNSAYVVNYAERYRYGETISTSFVESTVNYVIAKRFAKKQSMQWSKKGTHLLLQVRTKVLNNEWEDVFRKKYPHFRPVQSMETQKMKAVA